MPVFPYKPWDSVCKYQEILNTTEVSNQPYQWLSKAILDVFCELKTQITLSQIQFADPSKDWSLYYLFITSLCQNHTSWFCPVQTYMKIYNPVYFCQNNPPCVQSWHLLKRFKSNIAYQTYLIMPLRNLSLLKERYECDRSTQNKSLLSPHLPSS